MDNLESTRKLMMLDYDRRIAQLEEENGNLRYLNENFEEVLEKERTKYVFQRMLFITAKAKHDYPRVIDFIYGRTLTQLVEKKDEQEEKIRIRDEMIEGLYQEVTMRQQEILRLTD